MRTISDIIELWPSAAELARRLGLQPIVVQRWHQRGRIPGEYDRALIERALLDGLSLSFEDIALARANSNSDQHGRANFAPQDASLRNAIPARVRGANDTRGAA